VADADKSLGEHVQQEAPDELFGRQYHRAFLAAMGVVLPAKGGLAILQTQQSMIGNGYSVGVAR
jgi:hypothetical protein